LASKKSDTQQLRAEEQFHQQMDLTRAITNSLGEGVYAVDAEGRLTFMNPAAERMLGWKETDLLGQPMHEAIHSRRADDTRVPAAECTLLSVLHSGDIVASDDDLFTRRDGSAFSVSYTSAPIKAAGGIAGAVLAFRDTTERNRRLRREVALYAVTRALSDSNTLADATPKVLQAVCESLGWQMGALWRVDRGKEALRCVEIWSAPAVSIPEFVRMSKERPLRHGEGMPGAIWQNDEPLWITTDFVVNDNFPRAAVAAKEGLHSAFGFPIKLGNEFLGVMEFFSRAMEEPDPQLLEMMGTIGSQIGQFLERKLVEEELRKSEEQYRYLAEAIPQQVWTARPDGQLDFVNQRVLDYFGGTAEEILGTGWQGVVHPEDLPAASERWANSLKTGREYTVEFRLRRKADENYRWHLGLALPLRDSAEKIVKWFGTNTDIEERKRVEEMQTRINHERELLLEEVSTPVVPVWRGVLILPIVGSLDTKRMQRATEAAMSEVMRTNAHACIIDITGARIVDSHAVSNLSNLVSALKLIGAEAIVTGVTAHAAHTLVGLGVDFTGMKTRRTLAEALADIIKTQSQSYKDEFSTNGTTEELR
jgi:PAS domain S-box-containing protein